MFDAGSTGSRIHVFKFRRSGAEGFELVEELFNQTKPGLSAYAADPHKVNRIYQKNTIILLKKQLFERLYIPSHLLRIYGGYGLRPGMAMDREKWRCGIMGRMFDPHKRVNNGG